MKPTIKKVSRKFENKEGEIVNYIDYVLDFGGVRFSLFKLENNRKFVRYLLSQCDIEDVK